MLRCLYAYLFAIIFEWKIGFRLAFFILLALSCLHDVICRNKGNVLWDGHFALHFINNKSFLFSKNVVTIHKALSDDDFYYFSGVFYENFKEIILCNTRIAIRQPGRVAQSVGHLTCKSGVLGSIPGLATYFRFSFRLFKKGSCQLLAKVCARSTS